MKNKKIVLAVMCGMILSSARMNTVYASIPLEFTESAGNDLDATSNEKFSSLIDLIVRIKKENPDINEQQCMQIMDESLNITRSSIGDIWGSLTESEKKLVIRYPFDALKVNNAKNIAISQTENKFGKNGLGDRSDAFRHGMWNAEMTILIGSEKAELFATAHEDKDVSGTESDGFTKEQHKNMDLHNNAVGRKLGSEHMSAAEEEMATIIYENIFQETSEFVWLHE